MSENKQESVGKLKINDLKGKTFVIPFYQRGYRWTANEARKLFNDLLEFANSGETEYCLQPVVLQKIEKQSGWKDFPDKNEVLRVVDGQQRLTTIAILLNVLGISKEWDIYYLDEKKLLSKILAEDNNDETINNHFRNEVKEAFKKFSQEEKDKEIIKDLLTTSNKTISFLRYDIPNAEEDNEGHDAFLRLNDGKTPLTSSELIRALYMVNASGISLQARMEISKEWEIIENTLKNEQFWLMLNSKGLSDTPTRIDLLFALVRDVDLEMAKANPRIIFENIDDDAQKNLEKVWLDVLRCFWWMQSCYADVELFNYLCWINEFTGNSAKTIYDKWRSYPKPKDFKNSIIEIIQNKYKGNNLSDFTYESDKGDLRQLFVLLNILDCNHSKEKFRFDLYENESWDIEHIDSQTPNELTQEKDQIAWLESSLNELNEEEKKQFNNDFPNFEKNKEKINNFKEMANKIMELRNGNLSNEEMIKDENKNGIGNLALLNTSINRSYKNAIFPAKRKVIKDFIVSGDCYVPPCTQKVFMKFYTESPSKITYWLQTDFEGYSKQMEKYFKDFKDFKNIDSELGEGGTQEQSSYEKAADTILAKNTSNVKINDKNQNRISEAVSFIDFMNKYKVVIPKIQRLYVQGRSDSYGKKCLSSFADKLVKRVVEEGEDCPLDFVYGIEDDSGSVFYPLDGQQRLTTLLLLAWLCGENKEKKWSFRYESRRATECFIEGLLEHPNPELAKPVGYTEQLKKDKESKKSKGYLPLCSNSIKQSDWFLSAWEEDAGIAGMLEMLDSLYCKLLDSGYQEFNLNKIAFLVNYLDTSKDSYDQIFLKMNSRGKPLTAWENIKAILDKNVPKDKRPDWQEKINNTWPELLWEQLKANPDNRINKLDSKMLSIVELALSCVGYKEKVKTNTFFLAQWLENQENKDRKEEFYEVCTIFFSALEKSCDEKNVDKQKVVEQKNLETALTPIWNQGKWLWPEFTAREDMSEKFYKPLLAYYAAKQSTDADWMRVIWNIIENPGFKKGKVITISDNFSSAYQLIKELSEHASDILSFLADDSKEIKSSFASAQVKEEREKAKKIYDKNTDDKLQKYSGSIEEYRDKSWKDVIIEAEKYAFFKGSIRFLIRNEKGEYGWDDFDTKWKNAQKYFDKDLNYKNDSILLRNLISHFDEWEQFWKFSYDNSNGTWKTLLLERKWSGPVHILLTGEKNSIENKNENQSFFKTDFKDYEASTDDKIWKQVQEELVKTNLLDNIVKQCVLNDRYANYVLYPYNAKADKNKYVLANSRNEILSKALKDNKITTDQKVENCNFFWGKDIDFTYSKDSTPYSFCWTPGGNVYLLVNNVKLYDKGAEYTNLRTKYVPSVENKAEQKDVNEHTFFDVDSFIKELDRCIKEYLDFIQKNSSTASN